MHKMRWPAVAVAHFSSQQASLISCFTPEVGKSPNFMQTTIREINPLDNRQKP
jgi:hypothetical protein